MAPVPEKRKIVFAVPPQVHLLDLSGPVHIFYEAQAMGASINLIFVNTIHSQKLASSTSGLKLTELQDFDTLELNNNDHIFIPGLDSQMLFSNQFRTDTRDFQRWLIKQNERYANICSVCTGAFLPAEAKLLNGKNCTTHWKYFDRFRKNYPDALLQSNKLFILDGNITTSAGVSSGIDMALYLIERLYGPLFATKIAREVVIYFRRSETDPQLSVFLQHRNHIDDRIHRIQDHIAQHLADKITVEEIAELAIMSSRNVTRLFKAVTGITIGQYQLKLRLEKAKQLISENHKREVVATECGLSVSQLRNILRKDRR